MHVHAGTCDPADPLNTKLHIPFDDDKNPRPCFEFFQVGDSSLVQQRDPLMLIGFRPESDKRSGLRWGKVLYDCNAIMPDRPMGYIEVNAASTIT